MPFDFQITTRIVFGEGRLAELGSIAAGRGNHAVLVTGRRAMRQAGVTNRAAASLHAAGVRTTLAEMVPPEPSINDANRVLRVLEESAADILIGIGGGSTLDVAKACAVAFGLSSVSEAIGQQVTKRLPMIAVPTTAGSGAEVTTGAIMTDEESGAKIAIRGEAVRPSIALIDPDLLATVPERASAATGFDALAHGIEGLIARRRSPVSDLFATTALQIMAKELAQPTHGRSRERLARAALFGGLSVASASTGFPHRLQQAMGVAGINISHGEGLALVYPAWIDHVSRYAPAELHRVDTLLGGEGATAETVGRLRAQLGLNGRLRDTGVQPKEIPRIAAAVSGSVENDPGAAGGTAALLSILERSW